MRNLLKTKTPPLAIIDKLTYLRNKEKRILKLLEDVRDEIYSISDIESFDKSRKRKVQELIDKYNIQIGASFENEILGLGKITRVDFKRKTLGIYFLRDKWSKENFAPVEGMKFNAIVNSII